MLAGKLTVWNDGRSGEAGCLSGNLVLDELARVHGRFTRVRGTTFQSRDAVWVGRFCHEVYIEWPYCHWANVGVDQFHEMSAYAQSAGKRLLYLFVTAQPSRTAAIAYWAVPADILREVLDARGRNTSRTTFAVHIAFRDGRYGLDQADITEFHGELTPGPEVVSRLRNVTPPAAPALRDQDGSVRSRRVARRHGTRIGEPQQSLREFAVPLTGERSALLRLPVPLAEVDVSRIKGWMDLMSDVLTGRPAVAAAPTTPQTGAELLAEWCSAGVVGAWKDREEISDSSAFARELRERAQRRTRE